MTDLNETTHNKPDNQELTDTLIDNICAQLSQRDWSLKTLADRADLPYESVKKLVNHKIQRPSFFSIWQIANALGCSMDKLTGREDPSAAALHQISENASEIYHILMDIENRSDSMFH